MSRMYRFDLRVRVFNAQPASEPYCDRALDALTQATAPLWDLEWESQGKDRYAAFGASGSLLDSPEDLADQLAVAVARVLPDASIEVHTTDLDAAPTTVFRFGNRGPADDV